MKSIPDFSLPKLGGGEMSQKVLDGKATVICVWATWCSDCVREIPELNELVEIYKDNPNVNLLAISDEDEQTVSISLQKFPFNFLHLYNGSFLSDQIKTGVVKHYPQILVVNQKREIVYSVTENKAPILDVLKFEITKVLDHL